jgi:hypothetical protein
MRNYTFHPSGGVKSTPFGEAGIIIGDFIRDKRLKSSHRAMLAIDLLDSLNKKDLIRAMSVSLGRLT